MRWRAAITRLALRARSLLTTRLARDERGVQTVEYALLIALVVIVLLGAVQLLFGGITALIDRAREQISELGTNLP